MRGWARAERSPRGSPSHTGRHSPVAWNTNASRGCLDTPSGSTAFQDTPSCSRADGDAAMKATGIVSRRHHLRGRTGRRDVPGARPRARSGDPLCTRRGRMPRSRAGAIAATGAGPGAGRARRFECAYVTNRVPDACDAWDEQRQPIGHAVYSAGQLVRGDNEPTVVGRRVAPASAIDVPALLAHCEAYAGQAIRVRGAVSSVSTCPKGPAGMPCEDCFEDHSCSSWAASGSRSCPPRSCRRSRRRSSRSRATWRGFPLASWSVRGSSTSLDTLQLDRTRRDRCDRRRVAHRAAIDTDLDRKRPGC